MKKLFIITLAALATLTLSCNKQIEPEQTQPKDETVSIVKSFKVVMPETKAYLGENSVSGKKLVMFADGDQVTIFANTSKNSYTGTYNATAGEFSTTITDEADADETAFYAVYPAKYKDKNGATKDWTFNTGGIIAAPTALHYNDIAAVENGVDESLAIMLANIDTDGALAFRYGVAFIKFQVAVDNVKSISFDTSNKSARYGGRPEYSVDAEKIISDHGDSQKIITIVSASSFAQGVDYYVPIIPKESSNGVVTITYTLQNGAKQSISTPNDENHSFYKLKMTPGNIYNLGCPPVSFEPQLVIMKDSVENLPYTAANDLTIADAYSLVNCTDEDILVTCDGTIVTSASIANGIVTYSISENTEQADRTGYIYLKLGDNEIQSISVTQLYNGSVVTKEEYNWDFASMDLATITGLGANTAATAGSTWDFGDGLTMITNKSSKWNTQTIDGNEYKWVATGGKYGSGQKYFSFTTNSTGTVTVLYASGKDGENRALTINVNGTETTSDNVSGDTSDLKTVVFTTTAKGAIMLYSKVDNIRVFSISYAEN